MSVMNVFFIFLCVFKRKVHCCTALSQVTKHIPFKTGVDNVEPFLFSGIFNKAKIELFYKNKETFTGDGLKTFSNLSG